MDLNTNGLKLLDTRDLAPAPSPNLDIQGLKPLDATGLRSVEPQASPVSEPEDNSVPFGSFGRGFNRLQQVGTMAGRSAGLISDEEASAAIARDERDMSQYPMSPATQEGLRDIQESEGFGDSAIAILSNPSAIMSVVGESLVTSVAPLVTGAAGAVAGTAVAPGIGTAAGLSGGIFVGSFATEYSITVLDTMREHGVDTNDEQQITAAFQNPAIMEKARETGLKRGIPIAAFDALSGGVAGRILGPTAKVVGGGVRGAVVGGTAELGAQAVLGASGEAAAQIVDKGEIESPGEVLLEGVAELVPGVGEIAISTGAEAYANRTPANPTPEDTPIVPEGASPGEQVIGAEFETPTPIEDQPVNLEAEPEGVTSDRYFDDLLEDERTADEIRAAVEQAATFSPSTEWQELPDEAAVDGLEVKQDGETTLARIPPNPGTPEAPVTIETPEDVTVGAEQTAIPSPAQAEAGNYKKRHVNWQNFDIAIETEAGATRSGIGRDGQTWSVVMPVPYGDLKGTEGADGDPVDVSIGPDPQSSSVFIIDQIEADTKSFDEHKVMAGFPDVQSAKSTYEAGFSDGRGADRIGAISEIPVEELRQWLSAEKITKPFTYKEPVSAGLTEDQFQDLLQIIFNSKLSLNPAVLAKKIDVPIPSIKKVLGRLYASGPAGGLLQTKSGKYVRSPKLGPLDIVQYIASRGGLAPDVGGDVLAADLDKVFIPRFGKLVRQGGNDFNAIREMLEEGGYNVPDGDIMAAIRENVAGNRLYSLFDQDEVAERAEAQKHKEEKEFLDRVKSEINSIIKEDNLNVTPDLEQKMIDMIAQGGIDVEDAVYEVLETSAINNPQEIDENADATGTEIEPSAEIAPPGFEPEGSNTGPAQEDAAGRSQPVDAQQTGREESSVENQLTETDEPAPETVASPAATTPEPLAEETPEVESAPVEPVASDQDSDVAPSVETTTDLPFVFEAEDGPSEVSATQAKSEAAPSKIDDFGEKIEGAKKDITSVVRAVLSDESLNVATLPLSKSFPMPDYVKLAAEGVEPRILAYVALLRSEIPAKPRKKYKIKRWVEGVTVIRDLSAKVLGSDITPNELDRIIETEHSRLSTLVETSKLIETLPPEILAFAAKWRLIDGQEYYLLDDRSRLTGVRGSSLDDVKRLALQTIKAAAVKNSTTSGKRKTPIYVYKDTKDKTFFLGIKGNRQVVRLKTGFAGSKEARTYKDENAEDLQAQIDKMRKGPQMRRPNNEPRVGPSRRTKDVTPEMFTDAFQFRGVQFGNYVEGNRRQNELNEAYDALIDLAEILSIPSQALSLNGELGLAFGARGSGKAKAHFEPVQFVINLTKTNGAGSLAHEWLHSLDNYFSKQDNESHNDFISRQRIHAGGTREETFAAWKGIEESIKGGTFSKRSAEFDASRSKPYWNTTIEKAARSFERYIFDRLSEANAENDYLANIDTTGGAYPTSKEMSSQGIRKAFDNLFATLKTKKSPTGSLALYSLSDVDGAPSSQIDDLETALRDRLDDLGLSDVALRFVETIRSFANGKASAADARYTRGLIEVALDAKEDPAKLVDHEAIHGLRRLGVFADAEWRILSRQSQNNWMAKYNIAELYAGFPADIQIEEGIAHAFADWSDSRIGKGGLVARAFKKILAIIEALKNAFVGLGFKSSSNIFDDVSGGKVGRRTQNATPTKGDPAVYSMNSRDGDLFATEIVETVDGPRQQSVIPGAEKISQKEQLQRATEGKKKSSKAQKDASALPLFGDEKDQGSLFALRREVTSVEDGQRAEQGFLARGQFIDRAIRMPFDLFGGVTPHGEWKPGLKFSDKATKILTDGKINPDGYFGWLSGPLESARFGLIDRHGLDPDYVARERKRALDERAVLVEGADFLNTLKDGNISPEESRVLHAVLTGEKVGDADMQALAEPIREAIDKLGLEAVSLGLISRESYERNRGSYLNRNYLKHEKDQNKLDRFVGKMMGRSRKKIIGDQLKGRGIFFEVAEPRITRDDPDFSVAKRGKIVDGEKFYILDFLSTQTDALDSEAKPKTLKRIYWPADKDIPLKYQDWRNNGAWEVRGKKGGKLILWRDYTKKERANMGEILDASYNIGKTYLTMAHDLATGRFYKDISENPTWTSTLQPEGHSEDASETSRYFIDPDVQWVKVPDITIPKAGKTKRWGALAGKWVRSEIWRDLNEIEVMNSPGSWRRILTQWKLNKTARSPVVHMNNVMSNLMFMDLADIRMQDLLDGIKSYFKKDAHYHEALEHGAFGSDMISQEVRDNVLRPILDDLTAEMQKGSANSFFARARLMGRIADRIWSWAKTADGKMIDAYRAEDEIFRMATYWRRRQHGDTATQAADFARQQFLDYDIRAPWVNAARNSVLPFLSYTYRAAPLVAKAVATRPWKIAKYMTIGYVINALAYGWDEEGDEEKERASFREDQQGYTWLGTPRMVRMPFRDQYGMPMFLDIRRWIPAGDIFDTNQGSFTVPIPAPLQFGGPLMMGAELALNRQAFTGNDIVNQLTDNWWDKTTKISDWAWKSWMPSAAWVPNSWYWTKISNSISGATDSRGNRYSLPLAISSSVGVKLKPQDVEQGLYWRFYQFVKVERELKAQASRLGRRRERNMISEDGFNQGMHDLMDKMNTLNESRSDLAERANSGRTRQRELAN